MGIVGDHLLALAEELWALDILLDAIPKANQSNPIKQTRERLETERRELVFELDRFVRNHEEV